MIAPQESSSCIPNFLVILSAPLILFLCAIIAYFGLIPLKVEIHTLVMLGFIFLIFLFFIKHNANYAACGFRNSFYDISGKLQEYLNKNLLKIGENKKSLSSIDTFLDDYSNGLRNDNFSSIATTVFPMLGILGTFISIAMSMPDFSAQNTDALDHEITILLSGVGTAFYASIYGIFLSLWWIFFEKRGISKLEKTFTYIKSLYSKYVWSQNELDAYKYGSRQLENQNLVNALKEIFTADKVRELNEDYLHNLKNIVDISSSSFANIAEDMSTASKNVLATLEKINFSSDSIAATQNLDNSVQEFIRATNTLDYTISSMDDKLSQSVGNTFERIDKEISEVVVKLSDFAYLLDGHNEKILQDLEEYHREILKQFKK
ncbi:MAG: MotA/TolQ/ExbB proton channel family protein [Sulfurospirillaceae bacterium]|nr:MotA/TolQ/ExbB proton channel family protein [Sulfurospirillaceae bacterium]